MTGPERIKIIIKVRIEKEKGKKVITRKSRKRQIYSTVSQSACLSSRQEVVKRRTKRKEKRIKHKTVTRKEV